jgi:hypothetical protein
MHHERRKFLQQLAAACTAGVARKLGLGAAFVSASAIQAKASGTAAAAVAVGATASAASATSAASAAVPPIVLSAAAIRAVRPQVFEVIVRQAIAGAPWRDICAGPMKVNNIDPAEVEQEINRRKEEMAKHQQKLDAIAHKDTAPCPCNDCSSRIQEMRKFKLENPPGLSTFDERWSG